MEGKRRRKSSWSDGLAVRPKSPVQAPGAATKRRGRMRPASNFRLPTALPVKLVRPGAFPRSELLDLVPRPARPYGDRPIAHNRVLRRDRSRSATRQPFPPASGGASPRLKSAMRSGMPQRRRAHLSISGFDPPKASSSPPNGRCQRLEFSSPFAGPLIAGQNLVRIWSV